MIQKFHSSIDNPPKPKTLMQKDTCTPMFIEALFTIAKIWKQPMYLSTDEWTKMWDTYTYNGISLSLKGVKFCHLQQHG